MIATETGGASPLGEVWYAEADAPEGPWRYARKVLTHDRYSFYNPKLHPYFDQPGGRVIYFKGTYTHTFSSNPAQTPRYDYNPSSTWPTSDWNCRIESPSRRVTGQGLAGLALGFPSEVSFTRGPKGPTMQAIKFVHWEDDGAWLGYLDEYPDYWTQGETLDDLKEHLRDLYRDLTSGQLPGIRKVGELGLT